MQPLTGLTLPTEQELQKERKEAAEESAHWYLYVYKIRPCYKSYPHNWSICPYVHQGEKARRRDPRTHSYRPLPCPQDRQGEQCPLGDACTYTHNVYEFWLHPFRFRTQMCQDREGCSRQICFFAHNAEELRAPQLPDSLELAQQQQPPPPPPKPTSAHGPTGMLGPGRAAAAAAGIGAGQYMGAELGGQYVVMTPMQNPAGLTAHGGAGAAAAHAAEGPASGDVLSVLATFRQRHAAAAAAAATTSSLDLAVAGTSSNAAAAAAAAPAGAAEAVFGDSFSMQYMPLPAAAHGGGGGTGQPGVSPTVFAEPAGMPLWASTALWGSQLLQVQQQQEWGSGGYSGQHGMQVEGYPGMYVTTADGRLAPAQGHPQQQQQPGQAGTPPTGVWLVQSTQPQQLQQPQQVVQLQYPPAGPQMQAPQYQVVQARSSMVAVQGQQPNVVTLVPAPQQVMVQQPGGMHGYSSMGMHSMQLQALQPASAPVSGSRSAPLFQLSVPAQDTGAGSVRMSADALQGVLHRMSLYEDRVEDL